MGQILEFRPTVGMASANRDQSGYYAVIKQWVQDNISLFNKFFTITYSDASATIFLIPKAENISSSRLMINVTSAKGLRYGIYRPWEASASQSRYSLSTNLDNDPTLYIKSDVNFFMGYVGAPFLIGCCNYKDYDGNTGGMLSFSGNDTAIYVFVITNSSSISPSSSTLNGIRVGTTNNYAIKPFTFFADTLLTDMFYTVDGGTANPDRGQMFTVNSIQFAPFYGSVIVRI